MVALELQKGFNEAKLKRLLLIFFASLLIPTLVLVFHAYGQLKWEAFHQHRQMARELANRIDAQISERLAAEEARSVADYSFLVLAGDPGSSFLQRSPLSRFPVRSAVPGVVGYFQVDSRGQFTSPLLPSVDAVPDSYGISEPEFARRLSLEQQVLAVLSQNQLVQAPLEDELAAPGREALASSEIKGQRAFDRLAEFGVGSQQAKKAQQSLARVEDLELESSFEEQRGSADRARQPAPSASVAETSKREKRREQISVPEPLSRNDIRITTFESEIDPFEFRLLESGHFVLFRKVWRDGERTIQGAVIDRQVFVRAAIDSAFRDTVLSRMSNLIVAYRGDVVSAFTGATERDYLSSSRELSGELLYQARLSAPLAELELIFTITQLPAGPGSTLLVWIAVILLIVLCGGFYAMYRLGLGQIRMARQQQDFVSAVSHELKTPLTSIQMYGEILRAGWADEDKKKAYYNYIYEESERLSRLINNVLQLARMTRNESRLDLKAITVGELMGLIASKITSQLQRADFVLDIQRDQHADQVLVLADTDAFSQVFINLVDNGIKFSTRAERKEIALGYQYRSDGTVVFTVRDFGPGIAKGQMKKIFQLFYRSENELTRETVGTGIGLALVHQLVLAMNGKIDVSNCQPGAEFSVSLKTVKNQQA